MRRILFIILAFTILIIPIGWSDIPQTISYQGILTDSSGSPVSDGFYELTFRICESETGPSEWSETHPSVEVKGGVFSVILGTGNPLDLPFRYVSNGTSITICTQAEAEFLQQIAWETVLGMR